MIGMPVWREIRWKPDFQYSPLLRVPSAAMPSRKVSSVSASSSRARMVAPGLVRSSSTAPVRRMNQPSGPLKNESFTSSRICTPLSQASSMVSTQSQFEVCGAPTRMPRRGTVPAVRQRASRSRARARARRTTNGRRATP